MLMMILLEASAAKRMDWRDFDIVVEGICRLALEVFEQLRR